MVGCLLRIVGSKLQKKTNDPISEVGLRRMYKSKTTRISIIGVGAISSPTAGVFIIITDAYRPTTCPSRLMKTSLYNHS